MRKVVLAPWAELFPGPASHQLPKPFRHLFKASTAFLSYEVPLSISIKPMYIPYITVLFDYNTALFVTWLTVIF